VTYNDHTGEECEYGHLKYCKVVEIEAGSHRDERQRGPDCWRANCEAHKRWKAAEQRPQESAGQPIAAEATLDTFKICRRWRFVTDPRDGGAKIVDVQLQLTTSHQVCGQCCYLVVG
jgi:hypothetical protein